ncbi:MAG: adenine phosphoribosyltransferase [Cryomorphaceae bacterium]|nr:adenine phosphoribosyltransferase [Cryomorphaceae bacterium]
MLLDDKLKNIIRDVPDFPKPGILFKDISTIMLDPKLSQEVITYLAGYYKDQNIDAIAGIESRGFLFGYPLAIALKVPFILIRKKGKLPYKKVSYAYDLEYGSAEIEMHEDAVIGGQKVLIHDDLLATGGSAAAAAELVKRCGGSIVGFNFLVNLSFLRGDEKLKIYSNNIVNLVSY